MDGAQTASILGVVAMVLGVVLAHFKFKPGQRQRVQNETGLAEINIAQGSLNLAKDAAEFATGSYLTEIERLRGELRQYRDDTAMRSADQDRRLIAVSRELAEMKVQLAATERRLDLVTTERDELRQENEHLRGRVASLEEKVRALKAAGH